MSGRSAIVAQLASDPRMLAIARRNTRHSQEAEDCLQDAAEQALRELPADHPNPAAWFSITLKRRCWAVATRGNREVPASEGSEHAPGIEWMAGTDHAASPEQAAEHAEQFGLLAALKADQRRALKLFAAGYSYRQICDLTGWTYTKANRSITEGRAALRDLAAA